jgi:hypothetical protein
MGFSFPVDVKLKDSSPVQLVLADRQVVEPMLRLYRVIVDWLSSVRFPCFCRKEFVWFGGDRHKHRRGDTEPFGELGDLADVQVALAR